MLAIDGIAALGGILYTIFVDSPRFPGYMHLLVTYHFGFTRRALIGTILSWFTGTVPIWYVYALAIVAWCVALVLFVAAFRKIFGFKDANFPLFVYLIGSPFFFKNFAIALGHFDIYGCIWALVALLIPVGWFYPLVVAGGCIVLILVHHLHFLLYVPTICFIVFVRYAAVPGVSPGKIVYGLILVLLLSATFVAVLLFGRLTVPQEVFLAYLRSRAADPIDPSNVWMWYSTMGQELRATWDRLGGHALRFPVYAALIALHAPVWSYFRLMIAALPTVFLRSATLSALALVSIGYIVIGVVAHDYSRWVSSWAVCMFLIMHAVRLLPSNAARTDAPIHPGKKTNLVLGWITTAIPRVGVTIPF
jgi:hypothetical protein